MALNNTGLEPVYSDVGAPVHLRVGALICLWSPIIGVLIYLYIKAVILRLNFKKQFYYSSVNTNFIN